MHTLVGIIRTQDELERALDELGRLRERAAQTGVPGDRTYNPGWHLALDLRCMLTVSEAITRSALERKESRGGHTREDYPKSDPQFGKVNVVQRLESAGLRLRREALPEMPAELKALCQERA